MKKIGQLYGKMMKKHEKSEPKSMEKMEEKNKMMVRKLKKYL